MARMKRYSIEFQDQACKLVTDQGLTQQEAADQLGVTRVTIQTWLKKRGVHSLEMVEPDFEASNDPQLLKERIKELEKKLARAEATAQILKKATAYFASQNL